MEELREELRRERREHEALRDIVLTSKLKAHMVRNRVPAGLSGRVKILRDADWAMGDEHVSAVLTPSKAPSPASTRISALRSFMQDPLEVMDHSDDEGDTVVIPPPPWLLQWDGPGCLMPIIDQSVQNFLEDESRAQ